MSKIFKDFDNMSIPAGGAVPFEPNFRIDHPVKRFITEYKLGKEGSLSWNCNESSLVSLHIRYKVLNMNHFNIAGYLLAGYHSLETKQSSSYDPVIVDKSRENMVEKRKNKDFDYRKLIHNLIHMMPKEDDPRSKFYYRIVEMIVRDNASMAQVSIEMRNRGQSGWSKDLRSKRVVEAFDRLIDVYPSALRASRVKSC